MEKVIIKGFQIITSKYREDFVRFLGSYKGLLIAMNAEKIANNDPVLKDLVNKNLAYPDGVGAVLALRQKGYQSVKIPGTELWLDLVNAYSSSKTFYLIGSTNQVINQTVEKLKVNTPNVSIVGFRNGFLKNNDKEELRLDIERSKPDVVFVAMGSPKQEFLMSDLFECHKALYMGLGGSFDVFTGVKKRAPKLYQKFGLEWFYRILKEPTRIKRQIVYIKFMWLLIFKRL